MRKTAKPYMAWIRKKKKTSSNCKINTYEYTIIGFVTFCLQFHHVFDEDFGVTTQQCFDAVCTWNMREKKHTQINKQ